MPTANVRSLRNAPSPLDAIPAPLLREAIREELDRRGWTGYRLARESEASKTSVYEYLRGEREIETDTLERLCDVLDLVLAREGEGEGN